MFSDRSDKSDRSLLGKIKFSRLCCTFAYSHYTWKQTQKSMPTTRTPNKGCQQGKPSTVTIHRPLTCNFTHRQITLFTVLTMYKTEHKEKSNQ